MLLNASCIQCVLLTRIVSRIVSTVCRVCSRRRALLLPCFDCIQKVSCFYIPVNSNQVGANFVLTTQAWLYARRRHTAPCTQTQARALLQSAAHCRPERCIEDQIFH